MLAATIIVVSSWVIDDDDRQHNYVRFDDIVDWTHDTEFECPNNSCSLDEDFELYDSIQHTVLLCCKLNNVHSGARIIHSQDVEHQVGLLIIEESETPRIPQDIFTNLQLISLRIIYSGLIMLNINDFTGATQLKQLNLTHNKIENLEPNIFIYAPNIEMIDLSNNHISEVCKNVPKLRILILTNNLIETISFKSNLIYLEIFMIDDNLLTHLNENLFQDCTYLKELCISHNSLNISKLNVAQDLEVFDMSNNPTSIHLPSEHFKIKNCDATVLNIDGTAVTIDASENRINSIVVDPETILLELNLSRNNYTSIQNLTILKFIRKLDLSFNKIEDFSLTSFSNMTELQILDLQSSGLKIIDFGFFSHQKDLFWLDISYNDLKEINFNMLTHKIEHLFIEGNWLTNVDVSDIHIALPRLKEVGLSNNNFSCNKLVEIRKQLIASNISMFVNEMVKLSRNVNGIGCEHSNDSMKYPIYKYDFALNSILEAIETRIKEIENNIFQRNDSFTENSTHSRVNPLSSVLNLV